MPKMANCLLLFLIASLFFLSANTRNSCTSNLDCLSISASFCSQNTCIPCQETNHCNQISPSSQCKISQSSYCEVPCLSDSDCSISGGFCQSGICHECKVNSDCGNEFLCMSIGSIKKCGNCIKDQDCSEGQVCKNNQCSWDMNLLMTSQISEAQGNRNLQVTAAVYTDSKYTTISIVMVSIYTFFVLAGGGIMMYCEDDVGFVFRQFNLIQALVSILFINVNYGTSVGFTTLLSVLNVASSFTFLPNIFALFLTWNFTGFSAYKNFNVYGLTGLFLRDLGGLLWGILFAAIFHGIAIMTKPSAPKFAKVFNLFGLRTAGKLLIFGSYQIMQVAMLQLVNATFEDGVQIVSWVLGLIFFLSYLGVIGYFGYIEYQIYPIKSAAFKGSKREKHPFIYEDLRNDNIEKIKPFLMILLSKNFLLGILLVVTYDVDYLQVILQLLIGLSYTGLLGYYRPFKNNLIFGMEIVGEIGVALARLLVLIYDGTSDGTIIGGMDLIIWVLLAMGFIYSIYQPVRVLIRVYKESEAPNPSSILQNIKTNQVTPANKPGADGFKKQGSVNQSATEAGNNSSMYTEQANGLSARGKPKAGEKLEVQNIENNSSNTLQRKGTNVRESIGEATFKAEGTNGIQRQATVRESTTKESSDKPGILKKPEENFKIGSNLTSPKTTNQPNKFFGRQPTIKGESNGEAISKEVTPKDSTAPLSKRDILFSSIGTPKNGVSAEGEARFSFQKKETVPPSYQEKRPESPIAEYPVRVGINQFLQDPKLNLDKSKKSFPSLEKPKKSDPTLEKPSPNVSTDNSFTGVRQPEITPFIKERNNYNDLSNFDDSQNRSFNILNDSSATPLNPQQRNKNDRYINIKDVSDDPILPSYLTSDIQNQNRAPDRSPGGGNLVRGNTLERKPYPPEPIKKENVNTGRPPLTTQSQNYNRDILGREMKPPEKVNISDLIQNIRNKRNQASPERGGINSADVTNTSNFKGLPRNQSSDKESYGYDYGNPNNQGRVNNNNRYEANQPHMDNNNQSQINNTEEFNTLDPQKYLDPSKQIPDPYRDQQILRGRQPNNLREDPYGMNNANNTPSSGKPNPFKFPRKESSYSDIDSKLNQPVSKSPVYESRHMSHMDAMDNGDPYRIPREEQYSNPYSNNDQSGYRSQSQPYNIKKPPPSNSDSDYELIQKPFIKQIQHDDSDYYIQPPNIKNQQGNISNPGRLRNIQNEYQNPTLGGERFASVPTERRGDPYAQGDRMINSNYRNQTPDEMERSSEDMSSVNMRLYANANQRGELSPQSRQYEKAKLQNALKNLDDIKAWINAKNQVRTPTSDSKRNTYGERFRTPTNDYSYN